jgi:membrane fusion protein, multidrug efflux system
MSSRMQGAIAGLLALVLSAGAGAQAQRPSPLAAPPAVKRAGGALDCLLEPHMVVNVGSPVDGVLERVMVDRGDLVRRGQVVAQLQSGVEAAAVELSKARVEFGRRKVERNETLFQKQLISAQERDEMVTEARLHEQELKRDTEILKLRSIISPIDGVVVERRLAPGELIRAEKSLVLRLAQINPLNVEVVAPAELFGSVRLGASGSVSLKPLLPGVYPARVVVVDKLIDAASGTFGVRLQLPNPNHKIPAGIKCSVELGK